MKERGTSTETSDITQARRKKRAKQREELIALMPDISAPNRFLLKHMPSRIVDHIFTVKTADNAKVVKLQSNKNSST